MNSAVAYNDQAAQLILNGEYDGAINMLAEIIGEPDKIQCDTNKPKAQHHQDSFSKKGKYVTAEKTFPISSFDDHGDSKAYVYRKPLFSWNLPDDQEVNVVTVSVIIIFNLALAHHLKAIEEETLRSLTSLNLSEEMRVTAYTTALKLYEACFRMQLHGECELSVSQILALTNNCGQVHQKLNRPKKARQFLQQMLSTLILIAENGEAQTIEGLDGFLSNASQIILIDPEIAAAA